MQQAARKNTMEYVEPVPEGVPQPTEPPMTVWYNGQIPVEFEPGTPPQKIRQRLAGMDFMQRFNQTQNPVSALTGMLMHDGMQAQAPQMNPPILEGHMAAGLTAEQAMGIQGQMDSNAQAEMVSRQRHMEMLQRSQDQEAYRQQQLKLQKMRDRNEVERRNQQWKREDELRKEDERKGQVQGTLNTGIYQKAWNEQTGEWEIRTLREAPTDPLRGAPTGYMYQYDDQGNIVGAAPVPGLPANARAGYRHPSAGGGGQPKYGGLPEQATRYRHWQNAVGSGMSMEEATARMGMTPDEASAAMTQYSQYVLYNGRVAEQRYIQDYRDQAAAAMYSSLPDDASTYNKAQQEIALDAQTLKYGTVIPPDKSDSGSWAVSYQGNVVDLDGMGEFDVVFQGGKPFIQQVQEVGDGESPTLDLSPQPNSYRYWQSVWNQGE